MRRPADRLGHKDSDLACTAPGRRWCPTARRTPGGRRCRQDPVGGPREERRRERLREHRSGRSSCPHVTRRTAMSHTLMSLDAEWSRLARASRARRALRQWSIVHPALRGWRIWTRCSVLHESGSVTGMKRTTGNVPSGPMTISRSRSDRIRQASPPARTERGQGDRARRSRCVGARQAC
jgi:hypothetical protein